MTLPAFTAESRRVQHGARSAHAAIDRYSLPARRSAANPPAAVAAVDRWDRQICRMYGRTSDRYTDTAYYAGIGAQCILDCLIFLVVQGPKLFQISCQ